MGLTLGVNRVDLHDFSLPSRIADPDEGIGIDELQLAARNHGMLAEALRYDITPVGLHYLLVHYDVPEIDDASWRLEMRGAVAQPLTVTLGELRARPQVTTPVDAVGTAEWTGTPLAPLLVEAGVAADAVEVVFTGADHGVERGVEQDYQRALPLEAAMRPEVLLAYEMNGVALPPQHGFPCRLIVPGWYGMAQVKWLRSITVVDRPFEGYQNATAYRVKRDVDDAGTPVTRIRPRAAIQPPGHPDFQSRTRFLRPGEHVISGRAWSGAGPVVRVLVTPDDGASWFDAELEPAIGPWAWRRWTWPWRVDRPGRYELTAVAEDAAGQRQPVAQDWNLQGMANNMAQTVIVHALDRAPEASA